MAQDKQHQIAELLGSMAAIAGQLAVRHGYRPGHWPTTPSPECLAAKALRRIVQELAGLCGVSLADIARHGDRDLEAARNRN